MQSNIGKRLAAVDKHVRDKAVASLRTWLGGQADMSDVDCLKLWRALFYCYWLSDKPAIQEELASNLASMIHALPAGPVRVRFLAAFWKTMISEWHGLDKYRLDKFYKLFRFMHFEAFRLLSQTAWEEETLDQYIEMMMEGPLNSKDVKVPDSLRFHTIEVFIDILEATVDEPVPPQIITTLLMPFIVMMAENPTKGVFERIRTEVFCKLMEIVDREIATTDEDSNGSADAPEKDDDDDQQVVLKTSKLQIYFPEILGILFEIASHPNTRDVNRKRMYALVKEIKDRYAIDLLDGQSDEEDDEESDDGMGSAVYLSDMFDDNTPMATGKGMKRGHDESDEEEEEEEEEMVGGSDDDEGWESADDMDGLDGLDASDDDEAPELVPEAELDDESDDEEPSPASEKSRKGKRANKSVQWRLDRNEVKRYNTREPSSRVSSTESDKAPAPAPEKRTPAKKPSPSPVASTPPAPAPSPKNGKPAPPSRAGRPKVIPTPPVKKAGGKKNGGANKKRKAA
ncbi:hypothetical protein AMAG_04880 [Allomyces macrogynus ATCC 38327]|uniref:Ribosomal RNA-processing protein 1 n=1 Tax=Allomyces macrogynus (strain ATCC 38327) TaxID=578462 RepID=A0A0L0S6N1_ALLM3|nr:hypothetical protein AMAG_04880 [Allomyces macrogynus ATCC 38327]|eukprot:KNE58056.1 hypothetical protein AMAG_04880 [Allomyces macrogynus ATCC 38327]